MSEAARILIVDDELVICKACEKVFRRAGHAVTTAASGREALGLLEADQFDVVFTDLRMANVGGMEVLQALRQRYPETVPVVITGYATIASAVESMRAGAYDYLPKPFTSGELLGVLKRALERRELIRRSLSAEEIPAEHGFEGMIGTSPRMQEVYRLIVKVAPTDYTVLIGGESGTGKELTARAIHRRSKRRDRTFSAVDLSSLQSTLLESELFGHVKGSFTGAIADKTGIFDAADHGTIFLDEIGNLPMDTQARLLRVLQEKEILPVGSTAVKKVDVRLIVATNRNLKQLVTEGTFREDLFYRLNVFPVSLPPIRERPEDIPDLVVHFLRKSCSALARTAPEISPDAMELLKSYAWPGNVRELQHAVERLTLVVDTDRIEPLHIAAALYRTDSSFRSMIPKTNEELKQLKKQIRESSIQEVERTFVEESLARNGWNVSKAARDVRMQRSNLQALIKKYQLRKPALPA